MSDLRNLAAEVLQAIRKDNQKIIESIEGGSKDSQGAILDLSDNNRKAIDLLANDVLRGMTVLRGAVEEISITMKEELQLFQARKQEIKDLVTEAKQALSLDVTIPNGVE
jgi:fructose-1,6-bisphosphatase|tara:strand:+ start:1356 stop:1685 length:330 start_codon:yes stop_codon:yes gene_type:complete